MLKAKTARSERSLTSRSGQSVKTKKTISSKQEDMQSIEQILPMACAKFQCPYVVIVKKDTQQDDFLKALKYVDGAPRNKRMSLIQPIKVEAKTSQSESLISTPSFNVNTIIVNALYDNFRSLTEILLTKVKKLPRILMKVIALIAPFYRNLTKITLRNCGLDMYTIYEISKVLKVSTIIDVCLDGSSLYGADYTVILDTERLRHLSLARCDVNDDICKLIASKLHYKASAQNLSLLNLASNRITDEGVKHIGFALRSNRHLRYLNLSDNRITDAGAAYVLDVLIEFPLTDGEIMHARKDYLEYLRCKQELYLKFLTQCETSSTDDVSVISRKSSAKKKRTSTTTLRSKTYSARRDRERSVNASLTDDYLKTKAEIMAVDVLGNFENPFQEHFIKIHDDCAFSVGNMTLSYLNFSYNNLSYVSVKSVHKIILYQSVTKKPSQSGLVRIIIDGNNLPIDCEELTEINEILNRNLRRFSRRHSEIAHRKGRALKT